jgi:hypothetical protein
MAFDPLNSTEISAGEPTKQELFTKTKDNFDDHETRLVSTEAAVLAFQPILFQANGAYPNHGAKDNIAGIERLTFNLTVTAVRLVIETAGSAGSTEIDIKYKRGAGAWTSILTTRASVAFGAGDFGISTDAVLDATEKDLQAGDLLRCDLTASQTAGDGFSVFVEIEKT